MKHLSILIIVSALAINLSKAQSSRIEPFADAVPYNIHNPATLFLTNQDAETVKTFYTGNNMHMPDSILKVDDGYYHGYRLFYRGNETTGQERPVQWIQVVSINTRECIAWYEKTNPDYLMVPFQGMQVNHRTREHSKADFRKVLNHYKHLACRLYPQYSTPGGNTDELTMVLQAYNSRISLQSDQMLASGNDNGFLMPHKSRQDYWDLWMQCLEELDEAGYITLIEYSDIP